MPICVPLYSPIIRYDNTWFVIVRDPRVLFHFGVYYFYWRIYYELWLLRELFLRVCLQHSMQRIQIPVVNRKWWEELINKSFISDKSKAYRELQRFIESTRVPGCLHISLTRTFYMIFHEILKKTSVHLVCDGKLMDGGSSWSVLFPAEFLYLSIKRRFASIGIDLQNKPLHVYFCYQLRVQTDGWFVDSSRIWGRF